MYSRLVRDADQVVCQLLDNFGGFTGLNAGWVVCHQDGLFCANTDHTFGIVSTVDTSIVSSDQHEFLALDVQASAL